MENAITYNYEQAVSLINRLNDFEKKKIAEYINDLTLPKWLTDFSNRMRNIPVSVDEITELVEEVRTERYESSR